MGIEICIGCGSSDIFYDRKKRTRECRQCGRLETINRDKISKDGKVSACLKNAISFFKDGNYDDAKHYALEVLDIFVDNAPSLFVIAYYEEFVLRKSGRMNEFFAKINKVIEEELLGESEVQELQKLIQAVLVNMSGYEVQILQIMLKNMPDATDEKDLCEFVDYICPYLIMKKSSIYFLDEELIRLYCKLANRCTIPKTCFALIKSIEMNPDSPYMAGGFELKSKVKYFYEDFIIPLGNIVNSMKDEELRNKFLDAYNVRKEKYMKEAGF